MNRTILILAILAFCLAPNVLSSNMRGAQGKERELAGIGIAYNRSTNSNSTTSVSSTTNTTANTTSNSTIVANTTTSTNSNSSVSSNTTNSTTANTTSNSTIVANTTTSTTSNSSVSINSTTSTNSSSNSSSAVTPNNTSSNSTDIANNTSSSNNSSNSSNNTSVINTTQLADSDASDAYEVDSDTSDSDPDSNSATNNTSPTTTTTTTTGTATIKYRKNDVNMATFKSDCLRVHNDYRTAVNQSNLTWSDSLAASAQAWAENMAVNGFRHSGKTGENIASTTYTTSVLGRLLGLWVHEKAHFIEGCKYPYCSSTSAEVGHYTQIVWHSTTQVGCGFAPGANRGYNYLCCQYYKAGNIVGQYVY